MQVRALCHTELRRHLTGLAELLSAATRRRTAGQRLGPGWAGKDVLAAVPLVVSILRAMTAGVAPETVPVMAAMMPAAARGLGRARGGPVTAPAARRN